MQHPSLRLRSALAAALFGSVVSILGTAIVFVGEVLVLRHVSLGALQAELDRLREQAGRSEIMDDFETNAAGYAVFVDEHPLAEFRSWDRLGLLYSDVQGVKIGDEQDQLISRNERSIRLLAARDRVTGRLYAVAGDETKGSRAISLLGWVILGASPLLVVLSAVGGFVVAHVIVTPVIQLQRQISHIGPSQLSGRVNLDRGPREVASLASEFNGLLDRLEDAFEMQRRFAADASHELRTPLAALRAVGESAVLGSPNADDLRETIGSMLEECDRLSRIVEQLLSMARLLPDAIEVSVVDVERITSQVIERLEPLADEAGVWLVAEGTGVRALGDAMLVDRIISSLVDNAIRHGGRGCRVCVRMWQDESNAVVQISDNGRGIAPADLQRIWDPFARGQGAERGSGSGLGLALSRAACRAMNASISVQSAPGEGSTFEVRLPRAD